jgi:hypothetical protein
MLKKSGVSTASDIRGKDRTSSLRRKKDTAVGKRVRLSRPRGGSIQDAVSIGAVQMSGAEENSMQHAKSGFQTIGHIDVKSRRSKAIRKRVQKAIEAAAQGISKVLTLETRENADGIDASNSVAKERSKSATRSSHGKGGLIVRNTIGAPKDEVLRRKIDVVEAHLSSGRKLFSSSCEINRQLPPRHSSVETKDHDDTDSAGGSEEEDLVPLEDPMPSFVFRGSPGSSSISSDKVTSRPSASLAAERSQRRRHSAGAAPSKSPQPLVRKKPMRQGFSPPSLLRSSEKRRAADASSSRKKSQAASSGTFRPKLRKPVRGRRKAKGQKR